MKLIDQTYRFAGFEPRPSTVQDSPVRPKQALSADGPAEDREGRFTVRSSCSARVPPTRKTRQMISAQQIADIVIAAEKNRTGIAQISDDHPDVVYVATAYQVQRAFVQSKLDAGESLSATSWV